MLKSIGAEYGEGFATFRPMAPLQMDVVSVSVHLIDFLLWVETRDVKARKIHSWREIQRFQHYMEGRNSIFCVWVRYHRGNPIL